MQLLKRNVSPLLFCCALAHTLHAVDSTKGKTASALQVQQAPSIDGQLNEDVWKNAPSHEQFIQFSPRVGVPMSEQTEFRILYDADYLYIGVRCHDQSPEQIIARNTDRDSSFTYDDHLYFIFDTFHDGRNAYAFAVNALGAQWDGLISQNTAPDGNWDGLWSVKCSTDSSGWSAEIAIPFTTLNFNPEASTWGFNIERTIPRKAEQGRWSRPAPDLKTSQPSEAGDLTGIVGIRQATQFEFRPYGLVKFKRTGSRTDTIFDAGADLQYNWTPSLSATLSVNTDFAETEVDTPQINFTRFPLFFPEQRDFFLKDRAFYQFAEPFSNLLIPFHTRRIGLSANREVVPILGALKIAGQSGPYQIGFTGAYLNEHNAIDKQTVFATRIARDFGKRSNLGFIATAGDPGSNGGNITAGLDYRYRTTDLWENQNFELNTFILGTETDPVSGKSVYDDAYGISLKFPNEPLAMSFNAIELGEDLNPRMGYVRRTGIRRYSSQFDYIYRPDELTFFTKNRFSYSNSLVTNLDSELESYGHSFYPINVAFASNHYLSMGVNHYYDSFDFDFYIGEDFIIKAGEYRNTDLSMSIGTAQERSASGEITLSYGSYYGGNQLILSPTVTLHPSSFLELDLYHYYSNISRGSESLESHISSFKIRFKFSPKLNWSNTLQYNNIAELAALNSRLNWEFKPGSHFYIVFNQTYGTANGSIDVLESQLSTKAGINFRF